MAASFTELARLHKLREIAESNGRDDVVQKVNSIIQENKPDDNMSRLGRQETSKKKEDKIDADLNTQIDRISAIHKIALENGRDDLLPKIETIASGLQKEKFDREDVTEEIRGFGGIALESVTGGLLGDEFRAAALSKITGVPYETQLEEERRIEAETYSDFPVAATTLAVGTGLLPSAKLAKAIGVGKTAVQGLARQGTLGAIEGATYGFMEGEGSVQDRLETAAKMGAVGLGLGGLGGAVGGRFARYEDEVKKAINAEKVAQAELKGTVVDGTRLGTEVGTAAKVTGVVQKKLDDLAIDHMASTGTRFTGLAYGKALQQVAEETGIPLSRIRAMEMVGGKLNPALDYRNKTIADVRKASQRLSDEGAFKSWVPEVGTKAKVKEWVADKLRPIVKLGEERVSKSFGGRMQVMQTRLVKTHSDIETVFNQPKPLAFTRTLEADKSGKIRAGIANMSNVNLMPSQRTAALKGLLRDLRAEGGQDAVDGFKQIQGLKESVSKFYRNRVNSAVPDDPLYWPMQAKPNAPPSLQYRNQASGGAVVTDANLKKQMREILTPSEALLYENPIVVMDDMLRRHASLAHMHETFGLDNIGVKALKLAERGKSSQEIMRKLLQEGAEGKASFRELRKAIAQEGGTSEQRKIADELMRSLVVNGAKGPAGWVSIIRKWAYMGTIANPYSAVLNLGDTFNSMVNYGIGNTAEAMVEQLAKKGVRIGVDDIGLSQQATGEFVRDGVSKAQRRFNKISDTSFQISGFRELDRFGKSVAMKASLKQGRDLIKVGQLESKWGHVFTKSEMAALKRDLMRGKKSDIVSEFAAAQLARIQPIDMAQMPKWFLDHPNWRILYMMRTFGLKQLQQIDDLVVQQYKKGVRENNPELKKEAIKNGLAYTLMVGGGNSILQEARGVLKGDEIDPEDIPARFADFVTSTLTVNTIGSYQMEMMQKGDANAAIAAVAPAPVGMLMAPLVDIFQGPSKDGLEDFLIDSKSVGWVPFARLVQSWAKD